MDTDLTTVGEYRLGLVAAWFGASFSTLIFGILLLVYLTTPKIITPSSSDFKLYSALPSSQTEVSSSIETADARIKIIENFFKGYNSVLADYSNEFVTAADKYNLDYRLMPAIAMQESNGGKKVITDSNNPFGYGIYGNSVLKFPSWDAAIQRVAKGLREDYLDKGLKTPYEIMTKYTPPSVEKGGPWAKGVTSFMEELR